ncbi:MAG: YicC family protein [Deltaproteobacteria bacterium]|nr:YicC family protein [Deltaproteobacteria bacterium]
MIKSMTAFGRGEYELNNKLYSVEIKTLNNRYRDIIIKMPGSLQEFEDEVKALISSRIKRGRIEVSLQTNRKDKDTNYNLDLNIPLLNSYLKIFRRMNDEFGIKGKPGPDYLCQIKEMIIMKSDETDPEESRACINKAVEQALDSIDSMRTREGKAIEDDFLLRLDLIETHINAIEERSPVVVNEYREKLKNRIEALAEDIRTDEGRLAQEIAIFASRCDITEEIVRTKSHLKQFRNYMTMEDSEGRRLDFLIQELNREINTISSKAYDSLISARAVEVKAELEKLREQIQNVE